MVAFSRELVKWMVIVMELMYGINVWDAVGPRATDHGHHQAE
jgi:hypothetical protein